jgi:hypothetical protein
MRGNRSFVGIMPIAVLLVTGSPAQVTSRDTPVAADNSPHHMQFITVEPGVELEVLDWSGAGRPLILLGGLGFDAHVFDTFAPKLVSTCRVYAITRRGFGASSIPKPDAANYAADRLEADLRRGLKGLESVPASAPAPPAIPKVQASLAVESGVQIYSGVKTSLVLEPMGKRSLTEADRDILVRSRKAKRKFRLTCLGAS